MNTGYPSNFSYGASLKSQSMASDADFTILQFLYFSCPRYVLPVLTLLNLPCQVYVSALETLLLNYVDLNWQNVSIGVNTDGKQNWIANLCASSDVAQFLLDTSCDDVLHQCALFLKIPQNVCKSAWCRENDIGFAWCDFSPAKWTHTSAQNI